MRTLLIDGDILAYKVAHDAQEITDWGNGNWTYHANDSIASHNIDQRLEKLQEILYADKVIIALTDYQFNFRKLVDATYKSNRKGQQKPILVGFLNNYFKNHYRTFQWKGLEGDDVLGILATHPTLVDVPPDERVIVSEDKDLRTIPGQLYNPNNTDAVVETVSEEEADYFFYKQVLTGDTTDGYKGCPSVGTKTADKLLSKAEDNNYWDVVVKAYHKNHLQEADAIRTARLARILRASDYNFESESVNLWEPPNK